MGHEAVNGEKLHQVKAIRHFSDPGKNSPTGEPLHRMTELHPEQDAGRWDPENEEVSYRQDSRRRKGTNQFDISMYCGQASDASKPYIPFETVTDAIALLAGVATFVPPAMNATARAMALTSRATVSFHES